VHRGAGVVGWLSTLPGVAHHLRWQEAAMLHTCKAVHELHCNAVTYAMHARAACSQHAGLADTYMQAATQTA
jgi:hypothetical protein